MDKKTIGIGCVVLIVLAVVVMAFTGGDATPETTINVTDLTVSSQGYGLYDVSCTLVPDKDYSYLEMVVVFKDDSGAIIGKSPLAWNMNGIQKGQTIKVTGNAVTDSSSTTPSTAEVYFFDSAFSNDLTGNIYNQTVQI